MKNFMVSASLETPVIKSVGTLPLDSLLAAMIYRESEDIAIAHREIGRASCRERV